MQDDFFHFILDRLAVGSFAARSAPGWAAVVSVVSDEELREMSSSYGEQGYLSHEVPWLHVRLKDGVKGLASELDRALPFIREHILRGCVLIHCGAGISRSVALAIAYLVSCGYALHEAVGRVKRRRPGASPYDGYLDEITAYFRLHVLSASGPRLYRGKTCVS